MATVFRYQNYYEPNHCYGSLESYGRARRQSSGNCSGSFQGTHYVPSYSPRYGNGYGFGSQGSRIRYQPFYPDYGYGGVCNQPQGYGCSPLNYRQGACDGGISSYGYGGYGYGSNLGQSSSGCINRGFLPLCRPAYNCGSASLN